MLAWARGARVATPGFICQWHSGHIGCHLAAVDEDVEDVVSVSTVHAEFRSSCLSEISCSLGQPLASGFMYAPTVALNSYAVAESL